MLIHATSYIDPSIAIKERLPENIKAYISELEYFDKHDPDLYLNRVDDLWVLAKNAYADGKISKRTWDLIEAKYIIYSNKVFAEEERNSENNYI